MKHSFVTAIALSALIAMCLAPVGPLFADDYWPREAWRTATPESQGMRSEVLADLMEFLLRKEYAVDSILIVRNGYKVLDTYNWGGGPEAKHQLYSCTKSVTSTLIGIAIDKGYIPSVDQPLLDFFPEKVPQNPDRRKRQIALKHVLMMATGLECRDSYRYAWRGLTEMEESPEWVQHMIDLPMCEDPGARFEYCNGATFLLAAILQKVTGQKALAFAREHLFGPLGITDVAWRENPRGIAMGYMDLYMRPRDMARFGYLFLNNGQWNRQHILSTQWVAEATREQIPAGTMAAGYGYQWWVTSPDRYQAIGYEGQRIFIIRDRQMVVVVTSRLEGWDNFLPEGLLAAFILPAVRSDQALPDNSEAYHRLASLDHFWQTADYAARSKRQEALKASFQPKPKRYVNQEFGFSMAYDPDVLAVDKSVKRPFLMLKSGLTNIIHMAALAGDIPPGLALKDCEVYLVEHLKHIPGFSEVMLGRKEMIRLSDGSPANLIEVRMKSNHQIPLIGAGVIAYHRGKLIGALASAIRGPFAMDHLKSMVMSLRLE